MTTPTVLTRELAFLVIQFLNEQGYKEAAHQLERESGFYFDLKYFEEKVLAGEWDEVERYLSGFTEVHENRFSTKIYFELRKQKFLEALDNKDRPKALDILLKDLKVFETGHEDLFKEMTQLLALDNIREHEVLSTYQDANSARKLLMEDIKKIIEVNPQLRGKLKFPAIERQRLKHLLNQSLNWQHKLCKNPLPEPVIQTLFVDHICKPGLNLSISQLANNNLLVSSAWPVSETESSESSTSTLTDYALFRAVQTNPETAEEAIGNINNTPKSKPCLASNEVTSATKNYLPKTLVQTLRDDSPPVSMDFHPFWHTILLVGTNIGNIGLWDITTGEKLLSQNFVVWNIKACSTRLKVALGKDSHASVNRIIWSPDGLLFGVAFSKNIVQLYSYHGGNHTGQHLELDAHDGSVNDLVFSSYNQKLLVITCGDDKTIKTWDVSSGGKIYTFEGHNAPVYSICPHVKNNIHFFFSTSVDGKIKAWLYDTMGARVDYDAPGCALTKLAYSADDTRIFSCGTGKDGEPYLVEWDESEGYIIRKFEGLKKPCSASIHFDTTRRQLLAAGDDHIIKFWHMDNVELWTSTDANGGLLANPYIRFNKEGTLLAVAAKENMIKILAADDEILQKKSENHSVLASTSHHETSEKKGYKEGLESVRSDLIEGAHNQLKCSILLETISTPSQCRFLQLPVHAKENKIQIVRLTYNHAGNAILALASNGIHLLWKWTQNDLNLDGRATTEVSPHLWQPSSGLQFMSNDLAIANPEDPVSCFALSKNDSYLMSGSGGIISLFNMLTFKTLKTLLAPPPVVTCLAFYHEDNNIIAIGMDNSSILIYNVRANKVKRKLEGHSKRVTSLAFSKTLNALFSADVESKILVWDTNQWVKEKGRYLQMHGKMPDMLSDTHIQFHPDQLCFLAVRGTHLAIYEAKELGCVCQAPEDSLGISQATFSCDGRMVYASLLDGTLGIFHALNLELHSRIDPTAYLPTASLSIYPLAIAAHPDKPGQFAVGLTDGRVFVFEPKEPSGKWIMLPFDNRVSKQQE